MRLYTPLCPSVHSVVIDHGTAPAQPHATRVAMYPALFLNIQDFLKQKPWKMVKWSYFLSLFPLVIHYIVLPRHVIPISSPITNKEDAFVLVGGVGRLPQRRVGGCWQLRMDSRQSHLQLVALQSRGSLVRDHHRHSLGITLRTNVHQGREVKCAMCNGKFFFHWLQISGTDISFKYIIHLLVQGVSRVLRYSKTMYLNFW